MACEGALASESLLQILEIEMSFKHLKPTAPDAWQEIAKKTAEIGFDMPFYPSTGALTVFQVSSKVGGKCTHSQN